MKAMVFAAGFGTRLSTVTQGSPKCLVEVAGIAMLERVVEGLKSAGVKEVVINLHYRPEQIREFVSGRRNFGIKVHFTEEAEILGTGGGLKNAEDFFKDEECFFIHNSDVYSEISLEALAAQHQASEAVATLAVVERPTDRALLFDSSGKLVGYENKGSGERVVARVSTDLHPLGFSGIQVCSSRIFEYMRGESGTFSTIRAYLNAVKSGALVEAFRMEGAYWVDMGTPDRLEELRRYLKG
jgi:NDP-sugar pyrophosphorylase family protein